MLLNEKTRMKSTEQISETASLLERAASKIAAPFEQKFRSPLTVNFAFSWLAFNWKPLAFFVFSNVDIVCKITYITEQYSNAMQVFFYPLAVAIGLLIIPRWVNALITQYGTKDATKRILDTKSKEQEDNYDRIGNQAVARYNAGKKLALAIGVEDHNLRIQQLEELIKSQNEELKSERTKIFELNQKHTDELQQFSNKIAEAQQKTDEVIKEHLRMSKKANDEILELKKLLEERNELITKFRFINDFLERLLSFDNPRMVTIDKERFLFIYDSVRNPIFIKESTNQILTLEQFKQVVNDASEFGSSIPNDDWVSNMIEGNPEAKARVKWTPDKYIGSN